MKKVSLFVLFIGLMLLCASCGGKNESFLLGSEEQLNNIQTTIPLNSEQQQLNAYAAICSQISSEEQRLAQLITQAEDKLKNTQEDDVADTYVLEALSSSLSEARDYSNYAPVSTESGNVNISSEVTVADEAYNHLTQLNKTLEDAIKNVDDSISKMEKRKQEQMESLVWPGKTFTWEFTDSDGYVIEIKMRFGSWIKASDTENLQLAWQKVGGKGDAPDISSFIQNNYKFRADHAVMTFATLEYTNKTKGYDFSEQYPYECSALACLPELPRNGKLERWQGYLYFSNGCKQMNTGNSSYPTALMKKNHWGPITVAFAIANVFGPNYDEMGNPALDDVYFATAGDAIRIPAIWKATTPISLSESDYDLPRGFNCAKWDFLWAGLVDAGWAMKAGEDGKEILVLRYDAGAEYNYDRGGNSEMSVNLSYLYTNFQGDIVVASDSKENQGYLTVKVYGDEKLLWQSEKITGTSRDIHFDIDVTDVRKLKIESVTDENNPGPSVAIINDVIS